MTGGPRREFTLTFNLFILQERRLKEMNQGQQQQGQDLGIIRRSRKGVYINFLFVYFTGAPAEGDESGATTAGEGEGICQGVQ